MQDPVFKLLLLETPPGTRILLDFYEWTCGEHFMGVRSVPGGAHLCVVSQVSAPSVFWLVFDKACPVHVRRWSRETEEFVQLPVAEEERLACAALQGEYDARLGAYVEEEAQNQRPCWLECCPSLQKMPKSFFDLPMRVALGAEAAERRRRTFDRSQELEMIGVNQTLAWLQRAFLEMVLAHDVEAFEVWRDAIVLLCGCVKAVRDHATVFVEFCSTLRWQLIEAGGEVLWQDAGKNVILASVAQFVDDVRSDPEVDQRLVRAAELLTEVVPVGDMDEEDMPMFVDLNAGESY